MDGSYLASVAVLAVILCLVIFLALMLIRKGKAGKSRQPNYRVFFIMGAIMLPMGLVEILLFWLWDTSIAIPLPLVLIGLVFLVFGLVNRSKWKKE